MRRKAFTASLSKGTAFPNPTPFEVMAMDEAGARAWCARNGWTVHAMQPKARVKRKRWSLDECALQAVKDTYGLRYPVYITSAPAKRSAGWHQVCYGWQLPMSAPSNLRSATFVHRVQVAADQFPRLASQTIWHELCHAWQAERDMDDDVRAIERLRPVRARQSAEHALPYDRRPCEVEARSWEAHADEIAPCV